MESSLGAFDLGCHRPMETQGRARKENGHDVGDFESQ